MKKSLLALVSSLFFAHATVAIPQTRVVDDPSRGFIWPLDAPEFSSDPPNDYATKDIGKKGFYHAGMDLKSKTQPTEKTPVKAVASGKVVAMFRTPDAKTRCDGNTPVGSLVSAQNHGFGNAIIIKHADNIYSLYSHLDCIQQRIEEGDVSVGQVIGILGNSAYEKRECPNGVICNPSAPSTNQRTGFGKHLHFEIKTKGILGNPQGIGLHYAYTPLHADRYGYYDPKKFIGQLAAPLLSGQPTIMGGLSVDADGKVYVAPLILHERGSYRSLSLKGCATSVNKAAWVRETFKDVQTFSIYGRGDLIGTFNVSGFEDHCGKGGNYPQVVLTGKVRWIRPPLELLRSHIKRVEVGVASAWYETMNEKEIVQSLVARGVAAVSRPVPQPFWSKGLRLSSHQLTSLKQIIEETLKRAPGLLANELTKKGIYYGGSQERVGKVPMTRSVDIMDLNQDGQPEVYATVRWEGEPCDEMFASVLATWRGNWTVLRRSTYMAECPWFESAGDQDFSVSAVDIDGDGIAELILNEGQWEAWGRSLYRVRDGKLVKIMDIGDYGS